MKYAILGDVHGNWEALQAVLKDAETEGADAYVCVGDMVGYNPDPDRCIDRLRDLECRAVRGNHDHYCAWMTSRPDISQLAATAIQWTRLHLDEDQMAFLKGLPMTREVEGFTLVHSSLESPMRWEYVFDVWSAAASFKQQETQVCFHGHTHVPVIFRKHGRVSLRRLDKEKIGPGTSYFINVGSVGQPRDRNPCAAYVLYELEKKEVELRRVSYEIDVTQRKIFRAGLPEWLALRLRFGM